MSGPWTPGVPATRLQVVAHTPGADDRVFGTMVKAVDRDCYHTALKILVARNIPGDRYVEGYARGGVLGWFTQHGWLETAEGQIIEGTPAWWGHENEYIAVVRYDRAEVDRVVTCDPHVSVPLAGGRSGSAEMVTRHWQEAVMLTHRLSWGEDFPFAFPERTVDVTTEAP